MMCYELPFLRLKNKSACFICEDKTSSSTSVNSIQLHTKYKGTIPTPLSECNIKNPNNVLCLLTANTDSAEDYLPDQSAIPSSYEQTLTLPALNRYLEDKWVQNSDL